MALKLAATKLQRVQVLRGIAASFVVVGHALHEIAALVGRGGPTEVRIISRGDTASICSL